MTFFNSIPESANTNPIINNSVKHRVLIIDDNEMELMVFRSSLNENIISSFASSAKDALNLLRHQALPDLIVLDIVMPVENGYEFCRKLKADYQTKHIPIIFLTACKSLEDKTRAFEAGAIDYVTKPFFPEELEFRIQNQLRILEEKRRLEKLAFTDELTNLANRRSYNQALLGEWSRSARNKHALSLLLLDIDDFKGYNDFYGHDAGDTVLKRVAEMFSSLADRAGDLCARFGGEELVLLLPDCSEEGAVAKAEQAVAGVVNLNIDHSHSLHKGLLTASVGVATAFPRADIDSLLLFKMTDEALYQAKTHGKNRFHAAKSIGYSGDL